jgi:hypothetical protein
MSRIGQGTMAQIRKRITDRHRREGEGRANKKNVARGYMRSILGATSVARI